MPGIFAGAIAGGLLEVAGPTGGGGTPAVFAVPDAAVTHIIINMARDVSTATANQANQANQRVEVEES
jgi:hypothetical protein